MGGVFSDFATAEGAGMGGVFSDVLAAGTGRVAGDYFSDFVAAGRVEGCMGEYFQILQLQEEVEW